MEKVATTTAKERVLDFGCLVFSLEEGRDGSEEDVRDGWVVMWIYST